jgi:hypothetical protein
MPEEAGLLQTIILQDPTGRAGFLTNPDENRPHFLDIGGEKVVCLAKGGECRVYGEFYTGSLNNKESWVTPVISENCPNSCPYKYLVCEGTAHKDHNYTEYYPEYNKYRGEFTRYCKHFELIRTQKVSQEI